MLKITSLPFIHPQAYNLLEHASDFQMDQLYHGFMSLDDVLFQQYPYPRHMHKGIEKEELKKIWGMGYTLYGLLDEAPQAFPVLDSDLIIIPLHHTMVNKNEMFYSYVKGILDQVKCPVIIVDGWDQPEYSEEIAKLCPYFKRELVDYRTSALPIFFAIPEEKFCKDELNSDYLSRKIYDFSRMVPANFSWNTQHTVNYYKFGTEEEYYKQYQDSYYAWLCAKGGIFTGRTLEVIANNCCPYFGDIERYPKNTMHNFPKELAIEVKRMKGVYPGTITKFNPHIDTYIGDTRNVKVGIECGYINFDEFDRDEYIRLTNEIKSICKKTMTTKCLARYILEKVL